MDFILIDLERSVKTGQLHYWKDNKRGYTTDVSYAGRYSPTETTDAIIGDIDKRTVCISSENVDTLLNQ